MSQEIILPNVRIAFSRNLKTPGAQKKDDGTPGIPKYSCVFLVDGTDMDTVGKLKAAIVAAAKEKWPGDYQKLLPMLRDQKRLCYSEGPHYAKDGSPRQGWEGCVSVSSSRYADRGRPGLFDNVAGPDGRPVDLGEDMNGRIYAGCYVNAKVNIYAWDHPKFGRRVMAELLAVQYHAEGDAFSGASVPSSDGFEAVGKAPAGAASFEDDDITF